MAKKIKKQEIIVKTLFLTIEIIALLLSIFLVYTGFMNLFSGMIPTPSFSSEIALKYFLESFAITIIPIPVILITPFTIFKTLKTHEILPKFFKKNKYNKILFSIYLVLAIGIISFVVIAFTYLILFEDQYPPQFFPLDDDRATYTIIKSNSTYKGLFAIQYDSKSDRNKFWECTSTDNKNYDCQWIIRNHHETVVGKSSADLNSYLNKSVVVRGKFVYSKDQCIADKCKSMSHPNRFAAVDIYEIKEKN